MKRRLFFLVVLLLLFASPVKAEEESGLQEEMIYDILVDRFNIGDLELSDQVRVGDPLAYQGGDLLGITKKLDRIDQLGFTTIILSPIMANAADGYHGYWIEDFYELEEQFGTREDLHKLVEEAHGRDIKVVLEFVTNYVASSHPFVTDSSKEDWFKKNNFEQTPSTQWLDQVEVLNQDNKEVENYLTDVATFWMDEVDIDGFKINDADRASESFLENFTKQVKAKNPDFYLLAGVSEVGDDVDTLHSINTLDAVENQLMFEKMNESFTEIDSPLSSLFTAWNESDEQTSLVFVDNKNVARFSNNFVEKGRNALTTWKLTLTYMYTTPGVPVIYQGSDLPMYGPGFPDNQHLVLFNDTDPDLEQFLDQISAIRKQFPVLSYGNVELIDTSEAMSVYKRTYNGESMYIAINNGSESQTIEINNMEPGMQLRGLLGDDLVRETKDQTYLVSVPRETAEIYMIEVDSGFNWWLIIFISGVLILFIGFVVHHSRKQKQEENQADNSVTKT